MQSLIEQVKRLVEAKAHYARTGSSVLFDDLARDKIDFPALLAHMQAQQAVVDAAKLRQFWEGMVKAGLRGVANGTVRPETLDSAKVALDGATIALDAALEKVNDHEQ